MNEDKLIIGWVCDCIRFEAIGSHAAGPGRDAQIEAITYCKHCANTDIAPIPKFFGASNSTKRLKAATYSRYISDWLATRTAWDVHRMRKEPYSLTAWTETQDYQIFSIQLKGS